MSPIRSTGSGCWDPVPRGRTSSWKTHIWWRGKFRLGCLEGQGHPRRQDGEAGSLRYGLTKQGSPTAALRVWCISLPSSVGGFARLSAFVIKTPFQV